MLAIVLAVAIVLPRPEPEWPRCVDMADRGQAERRWTPDTTRLVQQALRSSNRARVEELVGCRYIADGGNTKSRNILDLRGIRLRSLSVEDAEVLRDADLTFAVLSNVKVAGSAAHGLRLDRTVLDSVTFEDVDLSNSVFTHLRSGDAHAVTLRRVLAHGALWDSVFSLGWTIDSSRLFIAQAIGVTLGDSRIRGSAIEVQSARGLSFAGATIHHTRIRVTNGSEVSLSGVRGTDVLLESSSIDGLTLSGSDIQPLRLSRVVLGRPNLTLSALEEIDWRSVRWRSFQLGEEQQLGEESRTMHASLEVEDRHADIDQAYRRLEAIYSTANMPDLRREFRFARMQFTRRHSDWSRWAVLGFQELLDGYGMRSGRLLGWAVVSWMALWVGFRWLGATRRSAALAAAHCLSQFAVRPFQLDGLLDFVDGGRSRLDGKQRFLWVLGGLWGLVLAFRAIGAFAA